MSDIAVVLLKDNVGATTGTLGVAFEKTGYKGQLEAAGYPGQTVIYVSRPVFKWRGLLAWSSRVAAGGLWSETDCWLASTLPSHSIHQHAPLLSSNIQGRYYKLAGNCTVKDLNGNDGHLELRTPNTRACFTGCAIAEAGQSGQPAYSTDESGNVFVRAVLSRGPAPGTCRGFGEHAGGVPRCHGRLRARTTGFAVGGAQPLPSHIQHPSPPSTQNRHLHRNRQQAL